MPEAVKRVNGTSGARCSATVHKTFCAPPTIIALRVVITTTKLQTFTTNDHSGINIHPKIICCDSRSQG